MSEDFEKKLAELTSKRKMCISDIRLRFADDGSSEIELHAAVVMLYANWEGGVRNTLWLYYEYVAKTKPRRCQIPAGFLGLDCEAEVNKCLGEKSIMQFGRLAERIQLNRCQPCRLPLDKGRRAVDVKSNLNPRMLSSLLERFGLTYSSEYESRATSIINPLAETRNAIAHGDYRPVDARTVRETWCPGVSTLLDQLEIDVRKAVTEGQYKSKVCTACSEATASKTSVGTHA